MFLKELLLSLVMDELLKDFLTETVEGLQSLEGLILSLETNPENLESVRDAFRILHTIKGTCGFLGLTRMQTVAHRAENVLSSLRDGALKADTFITSSIFISLDVLRKICEGLEEKGEEPQGDDRELLELLEKCLHSSLAMSPSDHQSPSAEGAIEIEKEELSLPQKEKPSPSTSKKKKQQKIEISSGESSQEEDIPKAELLPEQSLSTQEIVPNQDLKKESIPEKTATNATVRISLDVVDNLMNLVGELVLTRNQLLQQDDEAVKNGSPRNSVLTRLSHLTTELQQTIMKTRMQPIENAWTKLPRLVRDISTELNKKITLKQMGAETELDRQVIELIKDPLVHMVRNSADHGIESPEERRQSGKDETGTITLRSYHQGGHVIIEIRDDGKGLNPEKLKEKALEKGLIDEHTASLMNHEQLLQLIFKPGFSTAQNVTNISGRGVGMDVVRSNVEKLGGTIELSSQQGIGSTFTLKIPLTLSIISVLLVSIGDQIFAMPQLAITEILNLKANTQHKIEWIEGKPLLRWRNQILPLIDLSKMLNISTDQEKNQYVIILDVLNHFFGVMIDNVLDSQEIVVKPLSHKLSTLHAFSGSTILGNGEVVLILDPNHCATHTEKTASLPSESSQSEGFDKSRDTIILLFKSGGNLKAVSLALVSRIDEISPDDIQQVQGQSLFLYRDQLTPLMEYREEENPNKEGVPILIFSDRGYKVALKIDEIVDIIEDSTEIQLASQSDEDLGTAVINGVPTTIPDCQWYFKKAYPQWHERTGRGDQKNSRRILLVDDSPFFLNLITPLLRVSGYHVKTASSADEGMALCHKEKLGFHLIISDIEMPGKNGFDFIRELKSYQNFQDLPVVALSGNDTEDNVEKARAAGFIEFIPKTDQQALIRTLNQLA